MPKGVYARASLEHRFWSRVKKTSGCWPWTGSYFKDRNGALSYGQLSVMINGNKKNMKASRLSWEINEGPIPLGLCVLHKCDNPACVRPSHLFIGTNDDNVEDMVKKGRCVRGERVGTSKLTPSQVSDIKNNTGHGSGRRMAKKHGISASQVSRIHLGRSWVGAS